MALLTVFSAPKPFTNPHIDVIQRNAIRSWKHLGAEVGVLLVGEEAGLAQVAAEYGVRLLADVKRNEAGTPLVSSIFNLARQATESPFLAYVNGDILLLPDIVQSIRQITVALTGTDTVAQKGAPLSPAHLSLFPVPFLLIGQRWDLDVRQLLDFTPGWEERLQAEVHSRGRLHKPAGSDYFVFPRQAFTEMPDFAIGRAGWDNWMIYYARQQGWPVIDGTPSVMIVHQDHDYSHLPGGKPHYDLAESQQNMAMAGGLANMYMVLDAGQQLKGGRLQPAPFTLTRLVRSVERWLMPKDGRLRGRRGALARRFRRLRRRLYG
jgi:hypothetical protein